MKAIELKTDSLTVHRWITDAHSGLSRLRNKAHGEMLIRRRVDTIKQLVEELKIDLTVTLVRSGRTRQTASVASPLYGCARRTAIAATAPVRLFVPRRGSATRVMRPQAVMRTTETTAIQRPAGTPSETYTIALGTLELGGRCTSLDETYLQP